MTHVDKLKQSGTHCYCHLFADTPQELERMAERLHETVKCSIHDRVPHLDLSEHKRELALRYGAIEIEE